MIIGYTNGYYDLFHVGHLRLLQRAAGMCDRLIVGVICDEWAEKYKRKPVIPLEQRMEIIRAVQGVSQVVPVYTDDKYREWEIYRFDKLFVGNDHCGEPIWNGYERKLKGKAEIVFLPRTEIISTTKIREQMKC